MATLVSRLGARWEAIYPIASGAACCIAGYLGMPTILAGLEARAWAIENIFVAVFTLATVAAGFGLTIYTFLLTTESGFIGRSKYSIYYRHLLTFVLVATGLNACLALISVPGMVIKGAPSPYSIEALYVAIWAGLLGWSIGALFRAGHLFSIFAREHH